MLVIAVAFVIHAILTSALADDSSSLCPDDKSCEADQKESWTYRGNNGPAYWGNTYKNCYGRNQSPISIDKEKVVKYNTLGKLNLINYDKPVTEAKIENNGHTVEIIPQDDVVRSVVINGNSYIMAQCHFHWGCGFEEGSEHVIDGNRYAMELHCVNKNENNGKIAVIATLFQEVAEDESNTELQRVVEYLQNVLHKNDEVEGPLKLNLKTLLMGSSESYYRYQGSLTTPPCDETVAWTIMKKIATVGDEQMNAFRKLYTVADKDDDGCKMSQNYRPTQPLNGRKVYSYDK